MGMAFRLFGSLRVYARMLFMIHKMLPVLSARSQGNYMELMKSLLRLFCKYPYLRIASLRAALAYGSFFALWSCLAFRMKQEPFFAVTILSGHSVCVDWQVHLRLYSLAVISKSTVQGSSLLSEDVWCWLHGCWHFFE